MDNTINVVKNTEDESGEWYNENISLPMWSLLVLLVVCLACIAGVYVHCCGLPNFNFMKGDGSDAGDNVGESKKKDD